MPTKQQSTENVSMHVLLLSLLVLLIKEESHTGKPTGCNDVGVSKNDPGHAEDSHPV